MEIFDRMQIADKYRRMIRTLTGSSKDGYTVTLKDSFVYEDGTSQFWSKSKPELRKNTKKCHAHNTLQSVTSVFLVCFQCVSSSEKIGHSWVVFAPAQNKS